tara:strand:+ start:75 stop:968 length:894 start_codon:yes stop_codon:yes gene_type:complete
MCDLSKNIEYDSFTFSSMSDDMSDMSDNMSDMSDDTGEYSNNTDVIIESYSTNDNDINLIGGASDTSGVNAQQQIPDAQQQILDAEILATLEKVYDNSKRDSNIDEVQSEREARDLLDSLNNYHYELDYRSKIVEAEEPECWDTQPEKFNLDQLLDIYVGVINNYREDNGHGKRYKGGNDDEGGFPQYIIILSNNKRYYVNIGLLSLKVNKSENELSVLNDRNQAMLALKEHIENHFNQFENAVTRVGDRVTVKEINIRLYLNDKYGPTEAEPKINDILGDGIPNLRILQLCISNRT